uniref:Candidate secreted effector n=1 Tax=Meloidogyne incognita TaxID=6306 RepID=A0A914L890_MELIC
MLKSYQQNKKNLHSNNSKLYRYQSSCKHVHSISALIHQIKFCQKNKGSTFLINFSCNFKRFTSRKVLISRHDSENYRIWIRDKREKHFTNLNLKLASG